MARTNPNPQDGKPEPVKVSLREGTLKQIVGSGGGVSPTVAKLIGKPADKAAEKSAGPNTNASARDYRDYLRT